MDNIIVKYGNLAVRLSDITSVTRWRDRVRILERGQSTDGTPREFICGTPEEAERVFQKLVHLMGPVSDLSCL